MCFRTDYLGDTGHGRKHWPQEETDTIAHAVTVATLSLTVCWTPVDHGSPCSLHLYTTRAIPNHSTPTRSPTDRAQSDGPTGPSGRLLTQSTTPSSTPGELLESSARSARTSGGRAATCPTRATTLTRRGTFSTVGTRPLAVKPSRRRRIPLPTLSLSRGNRATSRSQGMITTR